MYTETISVQCLQLLKELANLNAMNQFYLVGGTSLALQIGHRVSEDLDFFTLNKFNFKNIKFDAETRFGTKNVKSVSEYGLLINGIKIDFVHWAFPPHYPLIRWNRIDFLDKKDIGLFKIMALAGRNRKKDIVDLYFIDKEVVPIEKLFEDFTVKYDQTNVNMFKNIQSLFIENEVAESTMPIMMKDIDFDLAFQTVREKFTKAIKKYFKIK